MFDFDKCKQDMENKWGKFIRIDDAFLEGKIDDKRKKNYYFNQYFSPCMDRWEKYINENKSFLQQSKVTKIPLSLLSLYRKCNGLSFFASCFNIYGLWPINRNEVDYAPFDIFVENIRHRTILEKHSGYVAIGSIGDYLICYDENELNHIYIINKCDVGPVLQTFETLDDLLEHYIYKLIDEYKNDYTKKRQNLVEIKFEKDDNYWLKNHWESLILRDVDRKETKPIICSDITQFMILRKIDFPFNQFSFSKDFDYNELENYCLNNLEENSECLMALCDMYAYGIGKRKNLQKANDCLQSAIKRKNPRAICEQGFVYEKEKDYKKAVKCYKFALENGSILAYQRLAHCLFEGYGIKKDPKEAFLLLKQASEYGNLDVAFEIGLCKLDGIGTLPSLYKSMHIFEELVDNYKYIPAMYKLGMLYYDEKIIRRDLEKALYYFKLASDLGDKKSTKMLEKIEKMEDKK